MKSGAGRMGLMVAMASMLAASNTPHRDPYIMHREPNGNGVSGYSKLKRKSKRKKRRNKKR